MTAMQFPAGDSRAPASGPLRLPSPLPRSLCSFLKSSLLPSPSFNFLLRRYHFLVVQWLSREAQHWSFSFSLSSSSENSELISFWIDWFDLLAVQETLKSLLQHLQFSSVTQSCPTLCDPMNHSTPGLPVHHQLPESTQTHVC